VSATTIRFASWNIGTPSAVRLQRQVELLGSLECDVVALQEVSAENAEKLEASKSFAWVWQGLAIRPRLGEETISRNRGCVLLASERFRPLSGPEVLPAAAAPERSVTLRLGFEDGDLSVASFHQVAGSDKKKWGPTKKRQTLHAIVAWLSRHRERAVMGIDANSPELDHPHVARNVYFFDRLAGDQEEHLLHDPSRSTHTFQDTYRAYLGKHPEELQKVIAGRADGPLAISHYNRGRPRRFDFIYATPDLRPERVVYHEETLIQKFSDHALVVADLTFAKS
jgi:exonuclease III